MEDCWLHHVWIENLTLHSSKHYTCRTHQCIYYTQTYNFDWRTVFRWNLHFTLHCVFLQALLLMQKQQLCDDVYYLTKHVIFTVWQKMEDNLLCHTMNEFPKCDSPALIVHTNDTFPKHDCAYFAKYYYTWLQEYYQRHLVFH